ncbi:MAG: glutamate 5-kinase [Alphaproteobacteria bacterium]|nr:glutamate 5-kinase [Alphaproteobacteria bacterium]
MSGRLASARRIAVKIGSSLLVERDNGDLRRAWLDALLDDVAALRQNGAEVLLVSSGAIALGRGSLGLPAGTLTLEDSQAAAAAGQIRLAHAYQESLARHRIAVAQVLLTADDTEQRRRYLNARATLMRLLALGAVPVINENDTVATDEIRFGDNDRLAARVAAMIGCEALVLLSDIDGLYERDPGLHPDAAFVPEVNEISPQVEAMAGASRSGLGRGGMTTKLQAARIALNAGCHMAIADGRRNNPLAALRHGGRATWFVSQANPALARKRWIAGGLRAAGTVVVDAGAVAALRGGKSLLPAGVLAIEGQFERGDAVLVRDAAGSDLARGLIAYSADEARRIIRRRTAEIEAILGYRGRAEMIHRDDLALL